MTGLLLLTGCTVSSAARLGCVREAIDPEKAIGPVDARTSLVYCNYYREKCLEFETKERVCMTHQDPGTVECPNGGEKPEDNTCTGEPGPIGETTCFESICKTPGVEPLCADEKQGCAVCLDPTQYVGFFKSEVVNVCKVACRRVDGGDAEIGDDFYCLYDSKPLVSGPIAMGCAAGVPVPVGSGDAVGAPAKVNESMDRLGAKRLRMLPELGQAVEIDLRTEGPGRDEHWDATSLVLDGGYILSQLTDPCPADGPCEYVVETFHLKGSSVVLRKIRDKPDQYFEKLVVENAEPFALHVVNGAFELAPRSLRLWMRGTHNGVPTSMPFTNPRAMTGRLDPATGQLSFQGDFRYSEVVAESGALEWKLITQIAIDLTAKLAGHPPDAVGGGDRVIECSANGSATVLLDGTASTDPDGAGDIVRFTWQSGSVVLGTGSQLSTVLPLGTHHVTLEVVDSVGLIGRDSFEVVISDTTVPSLSLGAFGSVQTANGVRQVGVTVRARATDACGATPTCRITQVLNEETGDLLGDGQSLAPWGSITGLLTASFVAPGTGSVYRRLSVECPDGNGNAASGSVRAKLTTTTSGTGVSFTTSIP